MQFVHHVSSSSCLMLICLKCNLVYNSESKIREHLQNKHFDSLEVVVDDYDHNDENNDQYDDLVKCLNCHECSATYRLTPQGLSMHRLQHAYQSKQIQPPPPPSMNSNIIKPKSTSYMVESILMNTKSSSNTGINMTKDSKPPNRIDHIAKKLIQQKQQQTEKEFLHNHHHHHHQQQQSSNMLRQLQTEQTPQNQPLNSFDSMQQFARLFTASQYLTNSNTNANPWITSNSNLI